MFSRLANVFKGILSLFIKGLERKNPEALLELEQENLRPSRHVRLPGTDPRRARRPALRARADGQQAMDALFRLEAALDLQLAEQVLDRRAQGPRDAQRQEDGRTQVHFV